MANISAIEKDGRAFWMNSNLQLRCNFRSLGAREQLHSHLNLLHLAGLDNEFSREIGIACLPDDDLVLSGQQENLLLSLEFLYVANIVAIDPDAGIPIQLCIAVKAHFAHDLAALRREMRGAERQKEERKQTRNAPEVADSDHDSSSHSGRDFILTRIGRRNLQKAKAFEVKCRAINFDWCGCSLFHGAGGKVEKKLPR